jgi:hypothetical protein
MAWPPGSGGTLTETRNFTGISTTCWRSAKHGFKESLFIRRGAIKNAAKTKGSALNLGLPLFLGTSGRPIVNRVAPAIYSISQSPP